MVCFTQLMQQLDANVLATNAALTSGSTYYAIQTVNGCRSTSALAVTVTVNESILGIGQYDMVKMEFYPNPGN